MKKLLVIPLSVAVLAALTVAVVLAFNVTGSDDNPSATWNCTGGVGVDVGSVGGLVPGIPSNVPVTLSDIDNCDGVGVTCTSVTATVTGTANCPTYLYTVGAVGCENVPPDESVVVNVPVTLRADAPNSCQAEVASLSVLVAATVP